MKSANKYIPPLREPGPHLYLSIEKSPGGKIKVRYPNLHKQQSKKTGSVQDSPYLVSNSVKFQKVRRPHALVKTHKLTSRAINTIKAATAILQNTYHKDVVLITCTLPGGTMQAMEVLSKHSSEILNGYLQSIRSNFKNHCPPEQLKDLEIDWIARWEPQQRLALHLHLVIALPYHWQKEILFRSNQKTYIPNYKSWWCQILETYSKHTGVDLFEAANGCTYRNSLEMVRVDCRPVRSNIGRYLTDNVSKWKNTISEFPGPFPRRWWGISASLKKKIKAGTSRIIISVNSIDEFLDIESAIHSTLEKSSIWLHKSLHPYFGSPIGYVSFHDECEIESIWKELTALLNSPNLYTQHTSGKLIYLI